MRAVDLFKTKALEKLKEKKTKAQESSTRLLKYWSSHTRKKTEFVSNLRFMLVPFHFYKLIL